MRLIGVDYGRRRIGVASADDAFGIASGLCVIDRDKTANAAAEFLEKIGDGVSTIVFGVPLGPNDEETEMSLEVRAFADGVCGLLAKRGGGANMPKIAFVDESFTSKKAAEISLNRKKKERRDKSTYDRIAACLILQSFIDAGGV